MVFGQTKSGVACIKRYLQKTNYKKFYVKNCSFLFVPYVILGL